MARSQPFRVVRRPKDVSSPYEVVVVDRNGIPHLPLTVFYQELRRYVADGTAKTYLAALLPFAKNFAPSNIQSRRGHRLAQRYYVPARGPRPNPVCHPLPGQAWLSAVSGLESLP